MPILHLPGEMMPGQLGPISRVFLPCRNSQAFTMSSAGMPSVMQTTSGKPASAASMMASAANGGGTKITDALAPVVFHRLRHGIEHRQVQMRRAAFAGRHAAHHVGAVGDGLLGVERAFPAGESLHDQSSVLIYQYAHACFLYCAASFDYFFRRVAHVLRPP